MRAKYLLTAFGLLTLCALAGCLVSGTFIIWEDIELGVVSSTFYRTTVNLEDNEDWQSHQEDINRIETVGFEVWMTNNTANEILLNGYIDDPQTTLYGEADVPANTFHVLIDVPIPGNTTLERIITYTESFDYLDNISQLKRLVQSAEFDAYAILSGTGVSGSIDSIKVVVTLNASDT